MKNFKKMIVVSILSTMLLGSTAHAGKVGDTLASGGIGCMSVGILGAAVACLRG